MAFVWFPMEAEHCNPLTDKAMIPGNLKSYVCIHVFEETKPVLLVSRQGGSWCFVCGGDHEDNASNYRVVGIGHVLEDDPSLRSQLDLQPDWDAERKDLDSPWIRTRSDATDA